jgi:hypothetical protein
MKIKKLEILAFFTLIMVLVGQTPVLGQSLSDIGPNAPAGTTYSQPQVGNNGTIPPASTQGGLGEELTLSNSDPTLKVTDIDIRSNGANPGLSSGNLNWTVNLYDLTNGHQETLTIPNFSVTTGDYIDIALSPSESAQTQLIGGDTYAFTVTTSSPYYLAGLFKSQESPPSYLPPGISSEFAVTGNGAGGSLLVNTDPTNGTGDLTYFIKTQAVPEPQPVALVPLGAFVFWVLRRFQNRKLA